MALAKHSNLQYAVRRSKRARAMRLTVYPDGAVVVTAPARVADHHVGTFVLNHASWISRHVHQMRRNMVLRIKRSEIAVHKKRAGILAEERCAYFARQLGVSYKKISIRAQKRRWGSCTLAGNLSFNYKIALIDERLADYVVVHELCHLRHFDHSKDFWSLVATLVPDYQSRKLAIRRIATMYH